jgi:hypothetical protein
MVEVAVYRETDSQRGREIELPRYRLSWSDVNTDFRRDKKALIVIGKHKYYISTFV